MMVDKLKLQFFFSNCEKVNFVLGQCDGSGFALSVAFLGTFKLCAF